MSVQNTILRMETALCRGGGGLKLSEVEGKEKKGGGQ